MDLVEQHRTDPRQFGIGLQSRQIHAVGHRDHPARFANLAVEPRRIADRRARRLAPLARHIFGGRAGREPARDEQQHLARAPILA